MRSTAKPVTTTMKRRSGAVPSPADLIRALPESVYKVTLPIPELGAVRGDYIVVRPADPDAPCALERMLNLDQALRHLGGTAAPLIYAAPSEGVPNETRELQLVRGPA